jgi:hypothetical protein
MFNRLILVFILIITNSSFELLGQCCSPGGPNIGSLSSGTVWKNNIKLSLYSQYGISSNYKEGNKISDFDLLDQGYYKFIGMIASYGFTENLTLSLESGYFLSKIQDYNLDVDDDILEGFGLTELTILPKYKILNSIDNNVDLSFGLGLNIPFTKDPQVSKNVLLPIDVQPSTNALGFISDIYLNYPIHEHNLQLLFFNRVNINSSSLYSGLDYRSGERVISSINILYNINDLFGSLLQFKHEFKSQDKFENKLIPSTGHNIFYMSPQLIYIYNELIQTSFLFDYPLYQDYRGTQLAIDYKISVALTYNLRL